MKTFITLLTSFLMILNTSTNKSPEDFEYELSHIIREFKENVIDKDECEDLKRDADDLTDEIEEAINSEDEYTPDELSKLRILKKETEAIEDYISVVGNCGGNSLSIDNFYWANRMVNADIVTVSKNIFCVDVFKLTLGEFVVYLLKNNSQKNYKVKYNWETKSKMQSGSGEMGFANSLGVGVKSIYNNREYPENRNIKVFNITCKEF